MASTILAILLGLVLGFFITTVMVSFDEDDNAGEDYYED